MLCCVLKSSMLLRTTLDIRIVPAKDGEGSCHREHICNDTQESIIYFEAPRQCSAAT